MNTLIDLFERLPGTVLGALAWCTQRPADLVYLAVAGLAVAAVVRLSVRLHRKGC